jgi:NTE family protein
MVKLRYTALFIFLFYVSLLAEKNITIYIYGDYSSIEYHLGVLSEIERLQIPIDSVVGSGWGAFVGALWSAGWSPRQIREEVKSWDSIPRAKEIQHIALWKGSWLVRHAESGMPVLEQMTESKPYFGQIFFDLRVQEVLWRTEAGSKIAFRETNDYPFPEVEDGSRQRILSTSVALRDTLGSSEKKYQQKLWKQDSSLIILRPHAKPNPDSLFEAGMQAVQAKRSMLAKIILDYQLPIINSYKEQSIPQPRFLYHPVFDSLSSELQGHLESFWNEADTGSLAIRNFLENLQKDGYYREVELALDTGSFLQIRAKGSPQLSLSLHGFGGTLFGANAAGNLNFRFINQFGYNLSLTGFYGQGARGAEPVLKFERFFMDSGDFFIKLRFYEYEPTSYFQRRIYEEGRLLKENGRLIAAYAERANLQIGVEFERKEIMSGAYKDTITDWIFYADEDGVIFGEEVITDISYRPTTASSMFPYVKWLWQSENYDRWFSSDGFMAEFLGGLKAISIASYGLPLYFSSQGKTSISFPLARHVSISGGSEFGLNFRRGDKGKMFLPEEIYNPSSRKDPALDNRFRFAMGMGFYNEKWQTPENASHCYGLLMTGLSAHFGGSGLFLAGGFANDGQKKFFAEPKLRIEAETFDFVLGQNLIFYEKSLKKRTFFAIHGGVF